MDEMSVEKWWNEICGRGKREKPRENPTQTPFRLPRNPHGVTETRIRDPSGGRRAPNRLRHEADTSYYIKYNILEFSNFMVNKLRFFNDLAVFAAHDQLYYRSVSFINILYKYIQWN